MLVHKYFFLLTFILTRNLRLKLRYSSNVSQNTAVAFAPHLITPHPLSKDSLQQGSVAYAQLCVQCPFWRWPPATLTAGSSYSLPKLSPAGSGSYTWANCLSSCPMCSHQVRLGEPAAASPLLFHLRHSFLCGLSLFYKHNTRANVSACLFCGKD